jgi:hypothetical protein
MIPDPFYRKVEDYGPLVWTKANWETSFPDTFRQYKEAWDHLKEEVSVSPIEEPYINKFCQALQKG